MSPETRIIKRYANRKLYDTQHSRYVTLDQISEMIRAGDDVKIVDNKTKEDLTSITLAQIIFEEEKKQRSFLPLQAMRNIIQHGGEQFSQLVSQAQKRVSNILPQKRRDDPDEGGRHDGSSRDAEPSSGRRVRDGLVTEFREWLQQSQRAVEEWQKRVDGRIRNVVEGMSPFHGLQSDVKQLANRIADLEYKLSQIFLSEAGDGFPPSLAEIVPPRDGDRATAPPSDGDAPIVPPRDGDGASAKKDTSGLR